MLDHTNYIVGAGAAVVLFPVLKRQNEGLALGYVSAGIVESTFIASGIVSLLAIVTLRQDVGGAGGAPPPLDPAPFSPDGSPPRSAAQARRT